MKGSLILTTNMAMDKVNKGAGKILRPLIIGAGILSAGIGVLAVRDALSSGRQEIRAKVDEVLNPTNVSEAAGSRLGLSSSVAIQGDDPPEKKADTAQRLAIWARKFRDLVENARNGDDDAWDELKAMRDDFAGMEWDQGQQLLKILGMKANDIYCIDNVLSFKKGVDILGSQDALDAEIYRLRHGKDKDKVISDDQMLANVFTLNAQASLLEAVSTEYGRKDDKGDPLTKPFSPLFLHLTGMSEQEVRDLVQTQLSDEGFLASLNDHSYQDMHGEDIDRLKRIYGISGEL